MCVAVCTRDRGDAVVETVDSVLAAAASGPHTIEIVVVDQSAGGDTAVAVERYLDDPRFRYVRTSTVGLSRARNVALASTGHDIVLFTDDDCVVETDWIGATVAAFDQAPRPSIVFGDVVAASADELGVTPVSIGAGDVRLTHLSDWLAVDGVGPGIGASMAVDRLAVVALGGFDPLLGAGGRFHAAEETDLTARALLAGLTVFRTPSIRVVHAGARSLEEFRRLTRRSMYGVGCSVGKLLTIAPVPAAAWGCRIAGSSIVAPAWSDLTRRRPPRVLGRVAFLLRGIGRGVITPTDRSTRRFVDTVVGADDIVLVSTTGGG